MSDAAFRLWASAIDYSREQRTDGVIEPADLAAIPRGTAGAWKASVANELVAAGLWHKREGGGWQIHDFLDWQDSSVEANRKREQARERMRRVRANGARTDAQPSPTDRSRSPDPVSDSQVSDPEATTDQPDSPGARDVEPTLQVRAAAWLADPQAASFAYPMPHKWPDCLRLVAVLAEVFGGAPQPIRSSSDPRMRVLLTHWSEGRSTDELEQAIRGAGRDEHLLRNPQLQTLATVLRDSNQVDRFTRLLTVAPVVPVRGGDRAGDRLGAQLARVAHLQALEDEPERKALP